MLGTEVEHLLQEQKLDYVASDREVDITEREYLREFAQDKPLSWIINCAAYTAVDRAEDEPELAFRINADGPLHLAGIAQSKNAKLIHLSTDYVFNGAADATYAETAPPAPCGVYGASKHRGERNIAENMASYFIIRTAWLYGKNGPNFIYTMLQLFREEAEVRVVVDQWGSPTYAVDLAQVILRLINADSAKYGIYHFTNAGRINWYDFASAIYEMAKEKGLIEKPVQILPIATEQYPTRAQRPQCSHLSKDKICRNFDIMLKPWQESLATFLSTLEKSRPLPPGEIDNQLGLTKY